MFSVAIPKSSQIIAINKRILATTPSMHQYDLGKLDSSINAAFYPGSAPFQHGGIAGLGAALCFYLCKNHCFTKGNKRTSIMAAEMFIHYHGLSLDYPKDVTNNKSALADIVLECAKGIVTKETLINWFEDHKR